MKCIFVDIEQCELEFFLFEDEVDDKMKKKLNNDIGLMKHSIWITRAKLYAGKIAKNQIEQSINTIFNSGCTGYM